MTEEAQENYQKLLAQIKEVYGDHSHIRVQDNELYFIAQNRYGFQAYITLTEEQAVELAVKVRDGLEGAKQSIVSYIEDYYYFIKQAASKELPEDHRIGRKRGDVG